MTADLASDPVSGQRPLCRRCSVASGTATPDSARQCDHDPASLAVWCDR
jgi:hypothetical protein